MAEAQAGARTALIVVDLQHDYVSPAGALPCPDAAAILAPTARMVAQPALFPAGIYFSLDDKLAEDDFGPFPPHCIIGTPGHAHALAAEEAASAGGVVRIGKRRSLSAFGSSRSSETTPLRALLEARGATHAVVCGLALEYCVLDTAVDCARMGLRTSIVAEASRVYRADSPRATEVYPKRLAQAGGMLRVVQTFEEALVGF